MKYLESPYGLSDRLFEDSSMMADMENVIGRCLELSGFNRIATPVVEYYQVFARNRMPFDEESVYKFIDKDGSILALRPDITIPCARVLSTKLKSCSKPIKVFYAGVVYRNNADASGSKENKQIGAEIFGMPGLWADIETLAAAIDCIKQAGLRDFRIDIGHAGIFEGICKELELADIVEQKLRRLINEKNLVELQYVLSELDINEDYKALLLKLPSLFGSPKGVFAELEGIKLNKELRSSFSYLEELYSILEKTWAGLQIAIDFGMTSDLHYYTGVIFKGYANGAGGVILSGGRYDSLTGLFDYDCPAVGFALYIDQIMQAVKKQAKGIKKREKLLVLFDDASYEKALVYSRSEREKGLVTSLIRYSTSIELDSYMAEYGYTQLKYFISERGNDYAEGSNSKG